MGEICGEDEENGRRSREGERGAVEEERGVCVMNKKSAILLYIHPI